MKRVQSVANPLKHPRICLIITDLDYGGAETQAVQLATCLKRRGWDIYVVSMLAPNAYVEALTMAGVAVFSLDMRRGIPDPRAPLRLASILRKVHPQILHCHMVHANLLGRVTRLLYWTPVVICTAHSTFEGGRRREWAYRITDFLCDLTTQVSQAGFVRYIRVGAVPQTKIRYIPNGVDTQRFHPDPEARSRFRAELGLGKAFTWLAVGRLEEVKDYPNLLQAFSRVVKAAPPTLLLIAGQGPLREPLERMAEDLGLTSCVQFLGLHEDVPRLMNAADGYVMSSAWEGLPMVLLEAAATGLPIVATDVGGNREIVLDRETGFLVPPRDPDALAQAMLHLMKLPEEERCRMGEAARQHVEANYSLEHVVDQWEALYRGLLAQKGIRVE